MIIIPLLLGVIFYILIAINEKNLTKSDKNSEEILNKSHSLLKKGLVYTYISYVILLSFFFSE